ncbi:MAG: RagB/SusD family nutrient uptake outer membrane protein [Parabacteroides sp.]|nr:RagB/SusD family nutrient uptake outer membrane protein [Parabacteroides sp.]
MKYNKFFMLVLVTLMLSGCSGFMDRYPLDSPSTETFYSNSDEMMMALNGCYTRITFTPWSYMPFELSLDMMSDIGWDRTAGQPQTIGQGAHNANSSGFYSIWENYYEGIGRCNRLLEGMEKGRNNVDANLYNQISAEARFVRAYCYLHLIACFGDVPLVTKTVSLEDAFVTRTSKSEIYKFIYEELDDIVPYLPLEAKDKQHAEKGTALGLKARAALYNGDYAIAAEAAKACMDLRKYVLHSDYHDLFQRTGEYSDEIMLSYSYDGILRHTQMRVCLSVKMNRGMLRSWVTFVPTFKQVDSYEYLDGLPIDESPMYDSKNPYKNRDPRMGMTIMRPGDISGGWIFNSHPDSVTTINIETGEVAENLDATGQYASFTGFGYLKYYDESELDPMICTGNVILMRYAEILLTYAEAKIELNQIDQSVYDAINEVRQRPTVDMPPITSTTHSDQASLRKQIRRERNIELALEGFRLYDIRRWELAEKAMNVTIYGRPNSKTRKYEGMPSFDSTGEVPNYDEFKDIFRVVEKRVFNPKRDYLSPIPQQEIDANPNLTQNEGH